MPNNSNDIFEGIDTSWSRVTGGKAVGEILYAVEKNFDFTNPSKHLSQLLEAYELLQKVEDDYWRELKSQELKNIILNISGLYLEASAETSFTNPGGKIKINVEAVNRSSSDITLNTISISSTNKTIHLPSH